MNDNNVTDETANEILQLISKLQSGNDKEVINFIDTHPTADFNVQDDIGTYFITYVVALNKVDVLEKLLMTNIKLDTLDAEGKSLMYVPIKFGFMTIIKILLAHDEKIVGIPLKHMTDMAGNTALHYALLFRNIECLKILLPEKKIGTIVSDMNPSCSLQDKNKRNALHHAIGTRRLDVVELILKNISDINCQDKAGETALHIACRLSLYEITELLLQYGADPNIVENEEHLAAIHYICHMGNDKFLSLLLNYDTDVNAITRYGMTALHICAYENKIAMARRLLEYNPRKQQIALNINIIDVYREIPLHIVFLKKQSNFIDFIQMLLEKSNINIANNNGDTCLHLLCKTALWKKFKDILKIKKINIVALNNNNEKPITYIPKEDMDEFLELTADSYIHILTSTNEIWLNVWERDCNNNINVCKDKVNAYIQNLIKKETIKCEDRTYPLKSLDKCLIIPMDEKVSFSTFVGSDIDRISGLIYLSQKYDNLMVSVTPKPYDQEICNEAKTHCFLIGDTIIYDLVIAKLYVSSYVQSMLQKMMSDNKVRYFVLLAYLFGETSNGTFFAHANSLLYDKKTNELERFETYGSIHDEHVINKKIKNYFSKIIPNLIYIEPSDYMKVGFQALDENEMHYNRNIGDPGGFCVAWSLWYVDMRIRYPSIKRHKLVKYIIAQINNKKSIRSTIRNYAANITKVRDKILSSVNVDVNDYLNGNINNATTKQLFDNFMAIMPPKNLP